MEDSIKEVMRALVPLIEVLEQFEIAYHIGGSLASSAYGVSRPTQDADVIADIQLKHVNTLVKLLETEYYIDAMRYEGLSVIDLHLTSFTWTQYSKWISLSQRLIHLHNKSVSGHNLSSLKRETVLSTFPPLKISFSTNLRGTKWAMKFLNASGTIFLCTSQTKKLSRFRLSSTLGQQSCCNRSASKSFCRNRTRREVSRCKLSRDNRLYKSVYDARFIIDTDWHLALTCSALLRFLNQTHQKL